MSVNVEKQMEALFGEDQNEEYSQNMDQISATYEYFNHKREVPRERKRSSREAEAATSAAAGLAQVIELGKGTAGRGGVCRGCQRDACGACSLCKRGRFGDCIDKFCSEEETGRLRRAHMKELYVKMRDKSNKGASIYDVNRTEGLH